MRILAASLALSLFAQAPCALPAATRSIPEEIGTTGLAATEAVWPHARP
jgi:hypothetical protein